MIRVIAFDLDDTLWEVGPVITRAESILANWLEKEVPGYSHEPFKLMPIRETLLSEDPTLSHRLTAFRQRLIETSLLSLLDERKCGFSCRSSYGNLFGSTKRSEFF